LVCRTHSLLLFLIAAHRLAAPVRCVAGLLFVVVGVAPLLLFGVLAGFADVALAHHSPPISAAARTMARRVAGWSKKGLGPNSLGNC